MYLAQKCNLLEDAIFTFPTGDRTASLNGHPSHTSTLPFEWHGHYLYFSVNSSPRAVAPMINNLSSKKFMAAS